MITYIDHDEEADVLYISFGKPVKAYCEEHGDILIRRHLETDEVVGVTVLFCDELIIKDTIHIDDPKKARRFVRALEKAKRLAKKRKPVKMSRPVKRLTKEQVVEMFGEGE